MSSSPSKSSDHQDIIYLQSIDPRTPKTQALHPTVAATPLANLVYAIGAISECILLVFLSSSYPSPSSSPRSCSSSISTTSRSSSPSSYTSSSFYSYSPSYSSPPTCPPVPIPVPTLIITTATTAQRRAIAVGDDARCQAPAPGRRCSRGCLGALALLRETCNGSVSNCCCRRYGGLCLYPCPFP